MLPQFGFIVAQAGADSQPPSNNNPYYARPPYMYHLPSQQQTAYEDQFYRPLQPLPPPILHHSTWHRPPSYRPWQPLPPPPPPSAVPIQPPPQPSSSFQPLIQDDHKPIISDHSNYETYWQEPIEISESKMLRRMREFNDLILWMDNEFWEQCDELYRERLQSLQEEIKTIQQGTHSAFKESLADIELRREQTIEYAEYFKNYELSLAKHQYDIEMNILQDEYESEKHSLHDMVLQAIDERRKMIKEDKEDVDIDDLFHDAYKRVSQNKRNLRKRNLERYASPSRLERRRPNRIQTLYNIHAPPNASEEDELEADFLNMKGEQSMTNKKQNTNTTNLRR